MASLPDVIQAYIAAYNDKDVEGMLACLSDNVSFRNISGGQVTAEASAFETRLQTVTNTITVADTTLVEIAYSAVVAKDLPNGWKAGQELAFSGASSFRIADGKIVGIVDES